MRLKAWINSRGHLSHRNAEAYRLLGRSRQSLEVPSGIVLFMLIYWIILFFAFALWLFGHSYLAWTLLIYGVWDVGKFFYKSYTARVERRRFAFCFFTS